MYLPREAYKMFRDSRKITSIACGKCDHEIFKFFNTNHGEMEQSLLGIGESMTLLKLSVVALVAKLNI